MSGKKKSPADKYTDTKIKKMKDSAKGRRTSWSKVNQKNG